MCRQPTRGPPGFINHSSVFASSSGLSSKLRPSPVVSTTWSSSTRCRLVISFQLGRLQSTAVLVTRWGARSLRVGREHHGRLLVRVPTRRRRRSTRFSPRPSPTAGLVLPFFVLSSPHRCGVMEFTYSCSRVRPFRRKGECASAICAPSSVVLVTRSRVDVDLILLLSFARRSPSRAA